MLTKEQILALNSKGYDLVFEHKDKIYSIKTNSLPTWSEEKKLKFEQESGLAFSLINDEWVFYNPAQYKISFIYLRYIGKDEKPEQPINCKNYTQLFYGWEGNSLDLSHWDVSKGLNFSYMFYDCVNLQSLDLSGWDISNCENFSYIFHSCYSLQSLDLSGWDVSNCENFSSMFSGCHDLLSLNLSSWDVGKGLNFSFMFNHCCSLQSLDLSGWDVSSGVKFTSMFSNTGIAKVNGDGLVELLQQGRWSEVKQGNAHRIVCRNQNCFRRYKLCSQLILESLRKLLDLLLLMV